MSELDPMRLFGLWMLTHEEADELMKDAVERGRQVSGEGMSGGADAFTDGFMAMVAEEKDRLKEQLANRGTEGVTQEPDPALEQIRFEMGELRGRLDQMQASLDAIVAAVGAKRG